MPPLVLPPLDAPAAPKRPSPSRVGQKKNRPKKLTRAISMHLPDELLAKLDEYVARVNAKWPGLGTTRSDVMRYAIARYLDRVAGSHELLTPKDPP